MFRVKRVDLDRHLIWCTGFRQSFDWIHLPILREDGWPDEIGGLGGPGWRYVARQIAARQLHRQPGAGVLQAG